MRNPNSQFRTALVGVVLVLTACSGSGTITDGPTDPISGKEEDIRWSEIEDFDIAPYAEEQPAAQPIEHDIPTSLLDGKVDRRVSRTGAGFRIQIFASKEKNEADSQFERAVAWWNGQQRTGDLHAVYPGDATNPQVYLVFRQPYYRVRLGNFASRSEAQGTLTLLKERFPSAFLVPDTVTLTR